MTSAGVPAFIAVTLSVIAPRSTTASVRNTRPVSQTRDSKPVTERSEGTEKAPAPPAERAKRGSGGPQLLPRLSALRHGDGVDEVTNIELFFDLVYVFAVTQLSELLVHDTSASGAVHTAILLAMVWQVWVYTTWSINYLDPNRAPVRGMLIVLMLGSLVLAAALPEAFHDRGGLIAITYVAMQAGRAMFVVWALHGERL